MKRYFIYIIAFVATLLTGCTIDNSIDTPDVVDLGDINVTFSIDGKEVKELNLASISHTIKVDVALNNENLFWTPVADKEWCKIAEETHRGNGSFTIIINANNSFDAREDATISFVASNYSKPMLKVSHDGNIFVLDEVYTASTKAANNREIVVTTPENTAWNIACDEWITATKGEATTADGLTTTKVTISWQENSDVSRYGTISLTREGDEGANGWFNIWQYGTDIDYDSEGYLLISSQEPAPLELRVPVQTVKDITAPAWVSYETIYNEDSTISYMLRFADNPSDARYIRPAQVVLSMLSGAADISLPIIKQDYYNQRGLLSGRGLLLFAKTWNEGGDVSQWEIDNEVAIVGDIDFRDIEDYHWVAIGTIERPFSGVFNGNGKKIYNLKASLPLFGKCENATIKNVTIDSSTTFEVSDPINSELNMASFANSIENTTIQECENKANLTLLATDDTHTASYVGGLVCKMSGTSKIVNSSNVGNIAIEQVNSAITLGGIVGDIASGSVEESSNGGKITFANEVYIPKKALNVGGVAGVISGEEGKILDSSNNAAIHTAGSNIGASANYTGGIVAQCNGTVSGCTNSTKSTISTALYAREHNVGGIVGAIGSNANILISGNTNGANISYNPMATRGTDDEGRVLSLGGIIGQVPATAAHIKENINNGSVETTSSVKFVYVGGVLGRISGVVSGEFKNNSVGSSAIINAPGKGRTTGIGGLVGIIQNGAFLDLADDTGSIKCTVKGGNSEGSGYVVGIGGLVGQGASGTVIKNASIWSGTLYVDSSTKSQSNIAGFGGIIGYVNGGVTIENCSTAGDLVSNMGTALKGKMAIGGIIGYCTPSEENVCTITGCTNNSDLSFGSNAGRSNDNPVYMGGIVGYINDGSATISDCHNNHGFFNRNGNNRVVFIMMNRP